MRGLKTTYYLRSMGATHAGKSTSVESGTSHAEEYTAAAVKTEAMTAEEAEGPKVCSILEPDCEACQ